MKNTHNTWMALGQRSWLAVAWLAALAVGLSGCGGGGSSAPAAVAVPATASDMPGRWENPAANWDAKWLAPATGQTLSPIWVLSRDGNSLSYLEGSVSTDGTVSATGKTYALNTLTGVSSSAVSLNWNAKATVLAGQTRMTFADGSVITRSASQPLAVQSEVTGTWTGQLGNGLVTLNYSIDPQGVLTGTSTTGCTYAGYAVVRSNSFVYDARVSESCVDGSTTLLNGIGSLATDKSRLTLTLLGGNGAYAKALYFTKK